MALALYRKYRPRTFAEVIGQDHVTEPLSQALRSGRLHHAYLFSGPRGCGKTSSARILARSLNCEQGPTPEPCGVCASCRSLANDGSGSIDVIEIDAASHGGVDDARELREKAFFAPASSRYKIYVIDEAHMVSPAGFNALLKLVEEPPDYVKFIFATTEPEKVLGTIRSRTHHYPFRLIPPAVLRPYLQQLTEAEGVHVDPAVLPLVVRAGGGSARDTLSVLDQLISGAGPEGVSYPRAVSLLGVTDVALIDEMCDALAAADGAAAYQTIDRVAEAGHDPRRFASDLLERFRDLIVLQQVPDAVAKGLIDGPADQLDQMGAQATRLGPATLSRCADIVHNGLVEMRGTTAPRLLLELITARMLLPGADDASNSLLQRLERMERRLTLSTDEAGPQQSHAQQSPAQAAPAAGGAGISAARAAAAAAVRRAPTARSGSGAGGTTSAAAPVSAPGGSGPGGSVAPVSAAGPGPGSAAPVSAMPGSATPVSSAPAPVTASPVSEAAGSAGGTVPDDAALGPPWSTSPTSAPSSGSAAVPTPRAAASTAPASGVPVSAAPAPVAPISAVPASGGPVGRRPEPAGLMPDAPEAPGFAPEAEVPGQLSAASIREVWPEIMTAVSRKSKKIAALAQGATVRDLEGQTVVLTFRFPAHAKMVAAEPALISDALYEALGGRWQIRCDVAGEGGGSGGSAPRSPRGGPSGPAQRSPQAAQDGPSRPGVAGTAPDGGAAPTRQREAAPRASVAVESDAGDEWPEPARPGGPATAAAGQVAEVAPVDDEEWPETARPGGAAAGGRAADAAGPGFADPSVGQTSPAGDDLDGPGGGQGFGGSGSDDLDGSGGGDLGGAANVAGPAGVPRAPAATPDSGEPPPSDTGSPPARTGSRNSAPAAASAPPAGGRAPSSGLAAARAAAAGAGRGTNPGPAAKTGAWSDGSLTEEAPYDPEYDGPPRPAVAATKSTGNGAGPQGAGSAFEGFDPGDEPLDDVIDEKTARQSSEQQAVQLLRDALGAEKISES